MKIFSRSMASALMLWSWAALAAPQALELDDQAITNLGIVSTPVLQAQQLPVVAARARVQVPPSHQQMVGSLVDGVVVSVLVGVGDAVVTGQVLAQVNSGEFLQLQSDFIDAAGAYRVAQAQLRRDETLSAEGIISGRRLQSTLAEADRARAAYRRSRQMLALSGLTEQQIERLERDQGLIDALPVRAPMDGLVLQSHGSVGAQVEALQPLFTVANPEQLWLLLPVPVEQLALVTVDAPLTVSILGGEVAGRIIAVGAAVDPDSQTVTVRGLIHAPDGRIKPGQLVDARIHRRADANQWRVPASALAHLNGGSFVFVAQGRRFMPVPVEVLSHEVRECVVAGDLVRDQRVVMTGVSALKALLAEQGAEDS